MQAKYDVYSILKNNMHILKNMHIFGDFNEFYKNIVLNGQADY